LKDRITALNRMNEAGYKTGLLIAPVILLEDWRTLYGRMIERPARRLSRGVKTIRLSK
jgi:spore photoproduct lyase